MVRKGLDECISACFTNQRIILRFRRDAVLYCVSISGDSYDVLSDKRDRLEDNGKICVLGGSYNNGGAVGVQYKIKR